MPAVLYYTLAMSDEEPIMRQYLDTMRQVGRVRWIGVRAVKRQPLLTPNRVQMLEGLGIEGDRYKKRGGKRQVSMIQYEHLAAISALAGKEAKPADLRRNLVIEGIPLAALRFMRFQIGEAIFEGTVRCAPCERMEQALGPGGYAAMVDMGGILARVVQAGAVIVGDEVRAIAPRR